jgi:hypothetical protein
MWRMRKIIYRLPLVFWMWLVRREWKPKNFLFLKTDIDGSKEFCIKWAKDRIGIAHWCPEVWGLPEWMMMLYLKSLD